MSIMNNYKDDILLIGIANIFSDLSHKLLWNLLFLCHLEKGKLVINFFKALLEMKEFILIQSIIFIIKKRSIKEFIGYLLIINEILWKL